jgi:peptidoglycan hydrolase CwlO-like protein
MDQLWTAVITTACTVAVSLLVTYLFNKLAGVPKKLAADKQAQQEKFNNLEAKDTELNSKIDDVATKIDSSDIATRTLINTKFTELAGRVAALEESVSQYPVYRAQSIQMQQQLQQSDLSIIDLCNAIKNDVSANREMLDSRLKSLESREKNTLRDKIYEHWRNFTSTTLNPRQAWTDMEKHAFDELVKDYESLGGNDYVHKVIIPEMSRLDVIPYENNLDAVKELFDSRSTTRKCE